MKTPQKLHKMCIVAVLLPTALAPLSAFGDKIDLTFGYYSLSAKTSTASDSIATLGAYSLDYRHAFAPSFEVGIGYSVVSSKVIYGGDLGYGLDIGAYYYPFSQAEAIRYAQDGVKVADLEIWRPYVGITFNQRNFQGVQTGYAGYGFTVGTQRSITDTLSLVGELRYINLSGGESSTANVLQVGAGISLGF